MNYQKGELLFDSTGKKANYNNKATKENMQFLKDLYEKDKVDLSLHNAKALLMAFSLSVVVKWDELL